MLGGDDAAANLAGQFEALSGRLPDARRAMIKRLQDLHVPVGVQETVPPAFAGLAELFELWAELNQERALPPDVVERINHLTWPMDHLVEQQLVLSDVLEYLDQLTKHPAILTRELLAPDSAGGQGLTSAQRAVASAAIEQMEAAPAAAAEWLALEQARRAREEAARRKRRQRNAVAIGVCTTVVIPLIITGATTTGAPWYWGDHKSRVAESQDSTPPSSPGPASSKVPSDAAQTSASSPPASTPTITAAPPPATTVPPTTATPTTAEVTPTTSSAPPTVANVAAAPGVIAFRGGCPPFQVFAQNRWYPYGAAIRTAPNVLSKQISNRDPNQSFAVDGWVHGPVPYRTNTPPWNSNVWFHLADGSGWVSFAGVRAEPVGQDPTGKSKDGGKPVKLVPDCQGSAQ